MEEQEGKTWEGTASDLYNRPRALVALLCGLRGAIGLAACEDAPGDAGGLVGDVHGDHSRRFTLKQPSHPGPRR